MAFAETKVYYDGSHYIAIPHTEKPPSKRPKKINLDDITPIKRQDDKSPEPLGSGPLPVQEKNGKLPLEILAEAPKEQAKPPQPEKPKVQISDSVHTKKDLFNELYMRYISLPYKEREASILKDMSAFFPNDKHLDDYVKTNLEKKKRNLIARRVRLARKVYLQDFNYFVTLTYDDKLHTEESFKKKLKTCLRHLSERKDWKYICVWERSPKKQRLHLHGLFSIPDGTMPGMMIDKEDYNFNTRTRQITHQSIYFNENFGRSDFAPIDDRTKIGNALAYIMKYMEKSGEKIFSSRNLPQYFISDIMDEDIVCPYGLEDKKLLLFDDFKCWDEGLFMGTVSKDVIARMRKSN